MTEIKLSNKTVKMRDPKVRDLSLLDDVTGEINREISLVSNLCELPLDEVMEMDLPDYKKLQAKVQTFLA